MQTARLRALPQPYLVQSVLSGSGARQAGIPRDAEAIRSVGRLPRLLEPLATRIECLHGEWLAFERGWETWFLTGEFVIDLAREYGHPVVRIARYDGEGHVQETFCLISRRPAEWTRLPQAV